MSPLLAPRAARALNPAPLFLSLPSLQARLLLLPWTLSLTATAATVGLAARSLTSLGFPPPGCAPAAELAAAGAALEAARRREDAYRSKLGALAAECEAVARDRRRAAAKLARARAELEAAKDGRGMGEGGGGGGAAPAALPSTSSPSRWPPSPGGGPDDGGWPALEDGSAPPCLAHPITTRAFAGATAALALSAAWWARAGPPYPALAHKAVLAAAGPWALTFLLARAQPATTRVALFGGAWAMVGFVAAHWLTMPDGMVG